MSNQYPLPMNWQGKAFSFFRNSDCEFFPCHPAKDIGDFNCLFCFCPLYPFDDCGGKFVYLDNRIKDCGGCVIPHIRGNYEYITNRIQEMMKGCKRLEVKQIQYDTAALIQEALDWGFSQAGELNVKALVFMPEVREMCSADLCHQYNKNWRCPPGCGSIEAAAQRAAEYSYGILVQTIGRMEDDFDYETIQETGEKHKVNFAVLVEKLKARYPDILPMGAGTCSLCEVCTYPDAPCRFPDKSIASMEAYGLWVSKVCELSGIPYNNGKYTITYTSCYLLK